MSAAVSGGPMLSVTPLSRCLSTPNNPSSWRKHHSTVSSPEFSDSKDEEDMEIDSDEHSPRYSAVFRSPSKSFTISSLSELHISDHRMSVASYDKMAVSTKLHDFQMQAGKTSFNALYSSVADDTEESESCFVAATQTLFEKARVSLASSGVRNTHRADSPKLDTLPRAQHRQSLGSKSGWWYIALLSITVAICASFYLHHSLRASFQCVEQIDVKSLHQELSHHVHGQHIAVNLVTEKMAEFLKQSDRRLLLLSFNGWTGIGKNFVSSIVSEHLPPSQVHKFIVPLHFSHGTDDESLLLSESIQSNLTAPSCGLHLFIIDEVDKASDGTVQSLVDTLTQLGMSTEMSGRAIFLLLTNDGATQINSVVARALMNGGSREDFGVSDLLPDVRSKWYAKLTSANLLHQTVPFLPLERRHVVQCTEVELGRRRITVADHTRLIDSVVNSVSYFPPEFPLFSRSGCRRVSHLVDLFV